MAPTAARSKYDHWRTHFEKMLYDNAELARVYLHAYQITGNEYYKRITTEILDYVVREITSKDGQARLNGYLEDYANLVAYTGHPGYVDAAEAAVGAVTTRAGASTDGVCVVVVTHHHAPRVAQALCVMLRHVCAQFRVGAAEGDSDCGRGSRSFTLRGVWGVSSEPGGGVETG